MVPKVKAFIWSLPTVPHVHHFLPATSLISYVSIVRIRPGIRVVFCHEGYSNPCHLGRIILFEGVCKNMIQGHVLSHSWRRSNPEQVSALETGCLKVYLQTTTSFKVLKPKRLLWKFWSWNWNISVKDALNWWWRLVTYMIYHWPK